MDNIMADVPGSIDEIDSSMSQLRRLLSILSPTDPGRPLSVFCLASMQFRRHTQSKRSDDLDKAIVHFTEAILLLPVSEQQHDPLTVCALFYLAHALLMRSEVSQQPEDAIYATKYLFHVRNQPHDIPGIPRHRVTAWLVDALALQVRLEAGSAMQNIREMAILTCELLTLEASNVDTTHLITVIHKVVTSKIRPEVPDQPLDELVECLRAARKQRPDLLEGNFAFAMALLCRYRLTCVNDDYEEAASILDEIIAYTNSHGNRQDESVPRIRTLATFLAKALALVRFTSHQTPEHLEEAIYRSRAFSSSSSFKEDYPIFDPETIAGRRVRYFGSIEGVEESYDIPVSAAKLGSETLIFQAFQNMEDLLFGFPTYDDSTMINEAIEKGRSILASLAETDRQATAPILTLFSCILEEAFDLTTKIEYLNESICLYRQVIEALFSQHDRPMKFPSLSRTLLARFMFFPEYRTQDLDEGLELLSQHINAARASLPDRSFSACKWAFFARLTRHPSVSKAYKTALSLIQVTPLFSPTLQLQHANLVSDRAAHSLALDYASYQVGLQQLEKAIETLERGRALLWSEMRHLRVSIDQLVEADSDLGHRFAAVNRDLEELTKAIPPSHKLGMDDSATEDLRAVDPFGRLVLKQRGLLKERAEIISQIRALPSFDGFLTSLSFDALRSASSSGPVIIINHSIWRCDILVLLHNMPPSLISLRNFYDHATTLKDKLFDSRHKHGINSSHYEETLAFVLSQLYELIGKPVMDRLHQLQVPEQSRIWWYPTSVFCSLPLHAMGPIPSDDGEQRYFLDFYICSYTPTLSALIQSHHRDPGSRFSDRPSILLVAQPDPFLPTVEDEIQAIQALDNVTSLISEAATPATVIDGFYRHQFVHFACHGRLEAGKPFEAGFELYGRQRLTLLEIVRSNLPTAEFAFLSACHTAEVTEGSVLDEGLHLAAAVQYCGFRSVVGTMWAMADEDGEELAKNFYKALFSNSRRDEGIPYHERSAKALRSAVKKLRRKRYVTLERWVNFVHYGA